jgi:23S rRNA pseudouridine1911/1915/1917 synthase
VPTESAIIPPELDGARLDRALTELFPIHSRSALARLTSNGAVQIDAVLAQRPAARVRAGQHVVLTVPDPTAAGIESQDLPLHVLFDDPDLLVVDKPPGLVVHPAAGHADGTLVNALLFHVRDLSGIGGEIRPGIVHRLDKDTSGVLIVAKNDATHRQLTTQWNTDAVEKEYLALVYGTPASDRGTIDAPIARDPRDRKRMAVIAAGRSARTDYEVVDRLRSSSLLRCHLRTGRTHQIRVHLKHLGHPIVGDPVYSGAQWKGIPDKRIQRILAALGRQMLHAERITFVHPRTKERITVAAEMPADMRMAIETLRTG